MTNLDQLNFEAGYEEGLPAFYQVEFNVDEPADTFLDMTGWGKGFVVVNAFNLGRFWEEGPQRRPLSAWRIIKARQKRAFDFRNRRETQSYSNPVIRRISGTSDPEIKKRDR